MAGKKKFTRKEPIPEVDEEQALVEKPKFVIMKPYIDTLTKETGRRDIDASKLPEFVKIRFIMNGMGEASNRYLGKSGQRYDFNGGVPIKIYNPLDKVDFVLKAKRNPECWEIVK